MPCSAGLLAVLLNRSQISTLHDNHRHNNIQVAKKGYDLGMLGVLIHVLGDAANNVGVIISGLVIWLTSSPARFYADPAVSMAIAIVILTTSLPLGENRLSRFFLWLIY